MVSGAAKRKKKAAAVTTRLADEDVEPVPDSKVTYLTEAFNSKLGLTISRVKNSKMELGGSYSGGTFSGEQAGMEISQEVQERASSLGFRVEYTNDKGRICMANSAFEPGQVIFEDEALVHGSSNGDYEDEDTGAWCFECDLSHEPSSCPRVRSLYPRDVADNIVEIEHALARLDRVQTLDRARAWIKALNRVRCEPGSLDQMAGLTAWQAKACTTAAGLGRRISRSLFAHLSNAQAGHILSVLNTNSHELEELGGSGLFPTACLMEHSCRPNCAFSTYGTRLRVCAIEAIGVGQALSIDYGNNAYRPTAERQEDLYSTYGFRCTCDQCCRLPDRCRAFKCPNRTAKGMLCIGPVCPRGDGEDPTGWQCLACNGKPDQDVVEKMVSDEAVALESSGGVPAASWLVKLLTTTTLHSTHFVAYGALEQRAKALASHPSTAREAAEAYERVLVAAESVLRPWDPEMVVILDRVAQAHVVAGDVERARDVYRRAHLTACRVSGQDFVPTAELAMVADDPPTSREALIQYFEGRAKTLKQIERRLSAPVLDPSPSVRDWPGLAQRLSDPSIYEDIRTKGYAVVDGVFGRDWAMAIRQEVRWLGQKRLLTRNRTQFLLADGRIVRFAKPFVEEADLHDDAVRVKLPELNALWASDAVEEVIEKGMQGVLKLKHGTQGRALKAQRNGGWGACFPWHYDNPGRPNQRAITCVLYLNPWWKEGDGGEMVFMPFLQEKAVIPPLLDRMVIFRSDSVLHRVMPSNVERFCITIWLDGLDMNRDEVVNLRVSKTEAVDVASLAARLVSCPSQRVLSRALYAEEYEESLLQCMKGAEGGEEMVQSHKSHLAQVSKNEFLSALIENLRAFRLKKAEASDGAK